MAGMSLSDYLLAEIREIAERPTLAELRERLHASRLRPGSILLAWCEKSTRLDDALDASATVDRPSPDISASSKPPLENFIRMAREPPVLGKSS